MTEGAATTSRPGRPRPRLLTQPTLWAYGCRLFPITAFLASGLVCSAWAVASRLDAPIEGTVLCILGSVALSIVFVDPAAPVTAPSVVPLVWRRVIPALFGVGLAASTWVIARTLAATVNPAPVPGGWEVLEWATIAASQLAAGAFSSRHRPDSISFGPGILIGLTWYVAVAAPRLHPQLFDPHDHLWRWLALLVASAAAGSAASLDPAHRVRKGVHR